MMETIKDILREMRAQKLCMSRAKIEIDGDTYYVKVSLQDLADRIERTWKSECEELRRRLKVAEEICKREISSRQKTNARCEMCMEDSSAGEDCPYQGEPCGCNSPTYGEYPAERECEPFVEILAAIRGEVCADAEDESGVM